MKGRRTTTPWRRSLLVVTVVAWSVHGAVLTATADVTDGLPCSYEPLVIQSPSISDLRLKAMNEQGVAVGALYFATTHLPCVWSEETGVQLLPMPPGTTDGTAIAINENGWILANVSLPQKRGVVLKPDGAGSYSWFEIVPESVNSGVHGINDLNQVVGWQGIGSFEPGFPQHAIMWTEETGVVPMHPEGWMSSRGVGINNEGHIIGNVSKQASANDGAATVRAFIQPKGGEMRIEEPSAPWVRTAARFLNEAGEVVVQTKPAPSATAPQTVTRTSVAGGDSVTLAVPEGTGGFFVNDLGEQGHLVGTSYVLPQTSLGESVMVIGETIHDVGPLVEGQEVTALYGIAADGRILAFCLQGSCCAILTPVFGGSDLDGSGEVDGRDLGLLLADWTG